MCNVTDTIISWLDAHVTWGNLPEILAVGGGLWIALGLIAALLIGKSIKAADDAAEADRLTSEERWAEQADVPQEESSVLG